MGDKQQNSGQTSADAAALRKRAEERARNMEPTSLSAQTPEEIRQLVHELRVHQIELEMQNEDLRTAQARIEAGRERYFDLYDLAPVGYCTLSEQGLILEANLAAATLLGMARCDLIEQRISRFILKEDQDLYYLHRKNLFETGEPQGCELRLIKPDGASLWAHLTGTAAQAEDGSPVCRCVISDITARKLAENDLQRVRFSIDNLSEGIFWVGETGCFMDVNAAACRKLGYTREELLTMSVADIDPCFPPEQWAPHWEEMKQCGTKVLESVHRAKNGNLIPMELVVHNQSFGNQQYNCVLRRDITERKQAEEALKDASVRVLLATKAAGVGVWEYDLVHNRLEWDEQMFALYGISRETFGGAYESWRAGVHPEDIARGDQEVEMALCGEKEFDTEFRVVWPDGTVRHIQALAMVLRDADGKPLRMIGTNWDITGRKEAENILRESEEKFSTAFQTSPYAITITRAKDGKFIEVNDAFMTMTGFTREEALADSSIGLTLWMNVEDRDRVVNDLRAGRTVVGHEYPFRRQGDQTFIGSFSARPILLGGEHCILSSIMDITERKQIETERQKFFLLAESSSEFIGMCDLDMNPVYVNPAGQRMVGFPDMASACRVKVQDYFFPEDQRFITEEFFPRILREGHGDAEIRFRHFQTGEPIWMFYYLFGIQDASGAPIGWATVSRDITERKRAESVIKKNAENLRNIVDAMQETLSVIALNGTFLYANQKAAWNMSGEKTGDIIGRNIRELIPKDQAESLIEDYQSVYQSGEPFHREIEIGLKKASAWFINTLKPIEYGSPPVPAVLSVSLNITEHKRMEEALRESLQRLELALQSGGLGMWDWNPQDGAVIYSDLWAQMLGYRPDEVEPTVEFFKQHVHPEDLSAVLDRLTGHIEGRLPIYESEHRLRTKSGRFLWVIDRGKIVERDKNGSPVRVTGIIADITERKQAEDALRESEKRFRRIFESNMVGIGFWGPDGQIYEANDVYLDLIHSSREALNKKQINWKELTPPEYMPADSRAVEEIMAKGFCSPYEKEYLLADGVRVPVLIGGALLDRSRMMGVAFTLDITERKQAEDALRERESLLNATGKIARIGGWEVDTRTLEVKWTEEIYHIHEVPLSYKPPLEEAINFFHPEDREMLRHAIQRALDHGEPYDLEIRFITAKGNRLWTRTICQPQVVDGQTMRLKGIFQDITERKKAEAEREKLQYQILQAQKMESVGRLAGGVAHDFNNMLGIIIGHADMLLEQMDPDHPFHAELTEIRKAGARSADLTRQLLAFARKQTVAPKVIDLNKVVEGMLNMLHRLIGEDIDMVWIPGDKVWPVKIDPGQIDQILANLCVNARDAIAGVGKMTIETGNTVFDADYCKEHAGFAPGEYVLLAVSDTGCGMDSQTQSHIFEPFFTTKELGKGTGLGLATVYGVVKQNDGFINVYSEPGQGTTFRIYLPRHRAKAALLPDKEVIQPAARGHETILLVEDEPAILEMTTMMLERGGYVVLAAATPGEAIRLATEHAGDIHLLMTDVVMPEMNGRDLTKNILSLYPRLKCLFMSGYTANVIAHHGILDEGVNFIQKPFSKGNLTVKVREVLDRD